MYVQVKKIICRKCDCHDI